jgi:ferric-dicitrate binding protein FerR (iron transport regulator)
MAMDCGKIGDLGARVLSGNGSPAEAAELRKHLLGCLPCREHQARLEKVWSLMGSLPVIPVTPAASLRTIARIRAIRPRRLILAGAAAAAVLLVAVVGPLLRHSPDPAREVSKTPTEPAIPVPTPEPKHDSSRDDVERNRVDSLLEEKAPPAVESPVTPQAPEPAPPRVAAPVPPAPPSPRSEVPPPPAPEPKALAKEEPPVRPAPPVVPPAPPQETTAPAGTIDRAEGTVLLVLGGVKSAAKAGQPLPEGAGLETSGPSSQAVVEFADGSRIALGQETALPHVWNRHLPVGKPAEGKLIEISHGVVAAQVAHQPAGEPMVFLTPQAEARVLGTRLSLSVTASATRLDVRNGKVKLVRRDDGASVEVGEGKTASAGKGITLAAKPAPMPRIILYESFDHGRWNPALVPVGESTSGLRFSTETGALSILVAQKPPPEVTPGLVSTPGSPGAPGGVKLPPDVSKKMVDSVTRGAATASKGDLSRNLCLETRQGYALSNETPLRLRVREWQSTSDPDRSGWIAINRATAGQSLLLERRGTLLQLWSEAAQAPLWKKELPCTQEWESLELWLTKDQLVIRRNDLTIHAGPNPMKSKVVQLSVGGNAKAELAQDEEVRFDDLELSWTTKADLDEVVR